jgi:hypothetical protein
MGIEQRLKGQYQASIFKQLKIVSMLQSKPMTKVTIMDACLHLTGMPLLAVTFSSVHINAGSLSGITHWPSKLSKEFNLLCMFVNYSHYITLALGHGQLGELNNQ